MSGPIHNDLGALYDDVGDTERARTHFEAAVQIFERPNDRFSAGATRFTMAVMYVGAAKRGPPSPRHRDVILQRAQAFAEAALRDFQHYQGRAAAGEDRVHELLADIAQALA